MGENFPLLGLQWAKLEASKGIATVPDLLKQTKTLWVHLNNSISLSCGTEAMRLSPVWER